MHIRCHGYDFYRTEDAWLRWDKMRVRWRNASRSGRHADMLDMLDFYYWNRSKFRNRRIGRVEGGNYEVVDDGDLIDSALEQPVTFSEGPEWSDEGPRRGSGRRIGRDVPDWRFSDPDIPKSPIGRDPGDSISIPFLPRHRIFQIGGLHMKIDR